MHCHQGSVLLYVKCSSAPNVASAVGRIAVGNTVACWKAGTIVVVVTTSKNLVAGAEGFHCPVEYVTC